MWNWWRRILNAKCRMQNLKCRMVIETDFVSILEEINVELVA